MKQRFLDANALMEYCLNQKTKTVDCNDIARFPSASVEPERPKGKWVDGMCDKCGYDGGIEAISGKANYCLICGADMRGE